MQKQLLIAGSVLGALALGHQAVNADTVPTTTDTSTAQSVQATAKVLPQVKNGILALAMSGLVALGGLIYKRKHL
ncbi:hypothetical protein [Leuconostoc mesenteroides]|uniref:hypothetical protein n=1 Tax=Leuconostoc mesenteroides TaxID=1245 RepID=UPI0003D87DA9|nr:hypothetical protein [Leuconostoc mesenteroides]AHF19153.1 hypothetical protein LMES_0937 [Leuconostoc mesenteroides KFRI-MG]ASR67989.1 hypothetical protein CBW60_00770 [Leuconostoc mesenteroides]AWV37861.1 hypothetical protein CD198_05005 [Leuconostoc mesenteroides]MBU7546901.1 hypothetical protein [Leuconostoc mesenteroides]MCT8390212.1 hypothetical protein [Leuconostoc mesenteroides]